MKYASEVFALLKDGEQAQKACIILAGEDSISYRSTRILECLNRCSPMPRPEEPWSPERQHIISANIIAYPEEAADFLEGLVNTGQIFQKYKGDIILGALCGVTACDVHNHSSLELGASVAKIIERAVTEVPSLGIADRGWSGEFANKFSKFCFPGDTEIDYKKRLARLSAITNAATTILHKFFHSAGTKNDVEKGIYTIAGVVAREIVFKTLPFFSIEQQLHMVVENANRLFPVELRHVVPNIVVVPYPS